MTTGTSLVAGVRLGDGDAGSYCAVDLGVESPELLHSEDRSVEA